MEIKATEGQHLSSPRMVTTRKPDNRLLAKMWRRIPGLHTLPWEHRNGTAVLEPSPAVLQNVTLTVTPDTDSAPRCTAQELETTPTGKPQP